jgi:hypothetical protein
MILIPAYSLYSRQKLFFLLTTPMKMERSQTSANKIQTPHPKQRVQTHRRPATHRASRRYFIQIMNLKGLAQLV